MVASDKPFYWLFQQHAERIQPLVAELLPRMEGYVFSAPVLKEREYRLDGLFLPPADQPELPVVILEAQMAADPDFLLRLNAEMGRLLLPEDQLPACSKAIRAEAAGTDLAAEIDDVIAAILVSRFNGRTIPEICAMGGITADDFTSSVAYREIFELGRQEGRRLAYQEEWQEGRRIEAAVIAQIWLQRCCGPITP